MSKSDELTTKNFSGETPEGERIMPDDWNDARQLKMHVNRYLFSARYAIDKKCLDIACGSGFGSSYMKKKGAGEVIGGDISEEGVNYANKMYAGDGISFRIIDAHEMPFEDKSIDVIVSHGTIEHLQYPDKFFKESVRILRDNGILICSAPNKAVTSPFGEPPDEFHFEEWYPEDFDTLIKQYFPKTQIFGENFTRKGFKHQVYLIGLHKILPFLRRISGGNWVADMAIRLIGGRKFARLEEINEDSFGSVDDSIKPYPQEGMVPSHFIIVAEK